jgi:hypothetical protein
MANYDFRKWPQNDKYGKQTCIVRLGELWNDGQCQFYKRNNFDPGNPDDGTHCYYFKKHFRCIKKAILPEELFEI